MSSLAHKTERVLNLLRELPPAKVNEVLDFAEYLKAKTIKTKSHKQSTTELPLYHMGAIEPDVFEASSPSDVAQKHDQWFHSQVETALVVADNPVTEFIPHETVSSRWNEKKKTMQARAIKSKPS
ncbi:MAG: DUF2281 domain-containing protein [Steroidobacteraceae bacterium]|nr:DUF2281 domain-containing protein [Deltaproteobacteria bacterium]